MNTSKSNTSKSNTSKRIRLLVAAAILPLISGACAVSQILPAALGL